MNIKIKLHKIPEIERRVPILYENKYESRFRNSVTHFSVSYKQWLIMIIRSSLNEKTPPGNNRNQITAQYNHFPDRANTTIFKMRQ